MSKLSVYTEVWVVIKYGDSDINEVYLNKDEAIIDCSKKNEVMKLFIHINNKYEVKTLDEAIDIIKDSVRDSESSWGNEDY